MQVLISSVYALKQSLNQDNLYTIRFSFSWRVRQALFHVLQYKACELWTHIYAKVEINFTVVISLLEWFFSLSTRICQLIVNRLSQTPSL